MSHTKDPWSLFDAGDNIHINETGGPGFVGTIHIYPHRADECRNNARRIVACVNACRGLTTEDLEQPHLMPYVAGKYQRQRDALLAALEGLLQAVERGVVPNSGPAQDAARAAIAAVKGHNIVIEGPEQAQLANGPSRMEGSTP